MDSLTQIVLGAAVGEKILGRKIGNRAMLYGAIAGTIPDLDVLVGKLFDPVTAVAIHRGFSHSILFFLLLSPLLGWLISKREKDSKVSVMNGAGLVFWALFTHALLDAFTTWGTQLLWPSAYKFAFKSIFVIDPLYTVPFIICLIAAMRKERTDYKRTQWNILGLKISTGYLLITLLLKGITYYKFRQALLDAKIEYAQMETKPSPFNTILWTANVETADAYLIGDYSFFDSQPITFKAYPKNHQLLGSLSGTTTVNRLIAISEGWYTISEKGGKLYFNDLRFGLLNPDENNPQFAFSYELLPENGALTVREVPKSKKDGMLLLQKLWNRIGGN
ncbi:MULTISPECIES: metal-dependent hydrolase [unclassified Flavobacterium]|uniref:metal-dependent hydrolase n=1 Tax=unclassified Flavobacterium TaxID=196869 RepID=UPI0009682C7F|nr:MULTISPECIES: metal-dependent hydrolase [unclassified Flavobacterium]MBN9283794.1 metal-dependent hydrolase [Flavobacterium sp.]OJV68700.1 MAG: metal-dependent hydrolase [Flavobacterium sp. 40-81]